MAFGAPDWWSRVQTDIVAQSIAQLDVDIIAQTLANLNVDIIAQTLANLKVDINAQTLAQVNIDIIAQTLANLNVDIIAQTLANLKIDINAQTLAQLNVDIIAQTLANLKVDINAQTIGNLAVDLNAQSIGDLSIDINAQTIDNLTFDIVKQTLAFLTVRPAYGSAVSDDDTTVVPTATDTRLFYIGGQGIIYDSLIFSILGDDPTKMSIELKVDGVTLIDISYGILYALLIDVHSPLRLALSVYDGIDDKYAAVINSPITFETSFEIRYNQTTGANVTVYHYTSYALTP